MTTIMETTSAIKKVKCKICEKEFDATHDNFYTTRGRLTFGKCKKCKVRQNVEVNKKNNNNRYKNNKEYYRNYMRVYNKKIIMCTCGATVSQGRKSDHLKTKIHARRLEELTEQVSGEVSSS